VKGERGRRGGEKKGERKEERKGEVIIKDK